MTGEHARTCPAYGNYQPPYEECNCGADPEHRCGVRGFTESGDTCPGCVAVGRVSLINPAITRQPAPVPNNRPSAHDLVIRDLPSHPMTERVANELADRRELGRAKYGTLLQAFNGRDPMIDAYQEALDLVAYLRQAQEEDPTLSWPAYEVVLELLLELRAQVHEETGL